MVPLAMGKFLPPPLASPGTPGLHPVLLLLVGRAQMLTLPTTQGCEHSPDVSGSSRPLPPLSQRCETDPGQASLSSKSALEYRQRRGDQALMVAVGVMGPRGELAALLGWHLRCLPLLVRDPPARAVDRLALRVPVLLYGLCEAFLAWGPTVEG